MTKHATMCSNTTKTARRSTRSMKKTTPTTPSSARKTRTKTRKHRFLSLRRHLFSKQPPPTSPEPYSSGEMTSRDAHQLNLFPLHPENLFQDKDDNVPITCFFDADTSAGAAPTTLDGLLWGGVSEEEEEDTCSLYSPSSLTCPGGAQDSEGSNSNSYSLERAAFVRSNVREREESEEKWVRYEEVIGWSGEHWKRDSRGLSLKLDYQEIMNAWMDKGPLYIDGDGPAIVPDLLHDAPQQQQQQQEQQDCSTSTVKVPVLGADDEGREVGEGWKMGQNREARVLRYKEKRQSRLFAKRIRYEVRKLNAEKRPRLKGRFVKRN